MVLCHLCDVLVGNLRDVLSEICALIASANHALLRRHIIIYDVWVQDEINQINVCEIASRVLQSAQSVGAWCPDAPDVYVARGRNAANWIRSVARNMHILAVDAAAKVHMRAFRQFQRLTSLRRARALNLAPLILDTPQYPRHFNTHHNGVV